MLLDITLDRGLRLGLDALKFSEPTEVQKVVIPAALKGQDLLVSAETGSGKTLAYLIPSAQRVLAEQQSPDSGTLVLVLVPTRELARQVFKNFTRLSDRTPLQAGLITGGNSYRYHQAMLRKNPEFIIATPGRMTELLADGSADLDSLQTLIMDEADRMLDMGLKEDVLTIAGACKQGCQRLLLSATLQHTEVGLVAGKIMSNVRKIAIGEERRVHKDIRQQVILSDDKKHRQKLLTWLLGQDSPNKTLVFSNTRLQADQLGDYLQKKQFRVAVLHGELSQDERNHVMTLFRQGKINVLVASDVAARGLDVKDIELVINFDMPRTVEDYIHRVGRTGRAGRQGLAISFVSTRDWKLLVKVEKFLGTTFERRVVNALRAKFKEPKKPRSSRNKTHSKKVEPIASGDKTKSRRTARKKDNHSKGAANTAANTNGSAEVLARRRDAGDGFGPLMKKR